MRYEIKYQPSFSLASVYLERGEQVMAESGAMVSMSPTIKLDGCAGRGGMFGAMKSAVGGESLFRTTFTADSGPGEVTLAPTSLGDIIAVERRRAVLSCSREATWRATFGSRLTRREASGGCSRAKGSSC